MKNKNKDFMICLILLFVVVIEASYAMSEYGPKSPWWLTGILIFIFCLAVGGMVYHSKQKKED